MAAFAVRLGAARLRPEALPCGAPCRDRRRQDCLVVGDIAAGLLDDGDQAGDCRASLREGVQERSEAFFGEEPGDPSARR